MFIPVHKVSISLLHTEAFEVKFQLEVLVAQFTFNCNTSFMPLLKDSEVELNSTFNCDNHSIKDIFCVFLLFWHNKAYLSIFSKMTSIAG